MLERHWDFKNFTHLSETFVYTSDPVAEPALTGRSPSETCALIGRSPSETRALIGRSPCLDQAQPWPNLVPRVFALFALISLPTSENPGYEVGSGHPNTEIIN